MGLRTADDLIIFTLAVGVEKLNRRDILPILGG